MDVLEQILEAGWNLQQLSFMNSWEEILFAHEMAHQWLETKSPCGTQEETFG
jgi:hypothetical protein